VKKVYALVLLLGFLLVGGLLHAEGTINSRQKFQKIEKVLLRGIKVDLDEKQSEKVEKIFDKYSKDVEKIAKSDMKRKKKVKKIVKLRKKRDKAMKKALERNQWKVYKNNTGILKREHKREGIDVKEGIEISLFE